MGQFIEWHEKYITGIEEVDNQHKKLFELINELHDDLENTEQNQELAFQKALKKAVDYVQYHFSTEEKLMLETSYPGYDLQKKEHTKFIKELLITSKEFDNNKHKVPTKFLHYLRVWVLHHIAELDKDMGRYITSFKNSE